MNRQHHYRTLTAFVIITLLCLPLPAAQPPPKKFELTVDSIMRGPDLVGYPPADVRWSRDGRRVYFRWKRAGEPRTKEPDLYVVNRDGSGLRRLAEEEAKQAPPASGDLSRDKKLTVFIEDGDVFLYDHAKGERRQITSTTEVESNARFTGDQKHISFMRQNNLYVLALDGGSLVQVTDIRAAAPASQSQPPEAAAGISGQRESGGRSSGQERRGTESQEWIKKEERELLEAVRERAQQREEQEARRKKRERRKPFQLAPGQAVTNLSLSPDGAYVVATIIEPPRGAKNTIVPNYVTESAYTEDIPSRVKVGDAQGRSRLAVINVETGDMKWVDHSQSVDPALRERTRTETNMTGQIERERGSEKEPGPQEAQPSPPRNQAQMSATEKVQGRERDVQMSQPQWSDDGKSAAILARAVDNKDRWVMRLDPVTGKTKTLAQIHDDAWVGGPGSSTLGWLPDGRIYFQSERDGFAHLYTVSADGGEPAQLTAGRFEVSDVRLSADKTRFYFTSNEGNPGERHLYAMSVSGGPRTRITTLPGHNAVELSPDEQMLAIVRSYSNRPPELYLQSNAPGTKATQVTVSPLPEFFSYNWIDPPIVTFKARDGATVYARLYKPVNFRRGGPAVVFVHGAGYLQNAHKWWSQYYREYMFHHLLMERGYIVIDVDYRGSAGYGRDWRTGIYRHMGGKDLTDQVDAVRYLTSEHGVDPRRVGIYGGSYGGFITLMAMFTEPDVFAAGAALRPVVDWAHYNHPYTSNILNLPQTDPEAYRRSSPIYFAAGLKGALLICHGMVDTNVHFQDTVRLVERLIELRKENWELAVYPVEDHTFERAASWADEYKRILKLFENNLRARRGATAARR
jgi:dipeptidyl aminopeptidase/acylaminoacyl peptidase